MTHLTNVVSALHRSAAPPIVQRLDAFVTDHEGPPDPLWIIENVATKPDLRRGPTEALLHELLGHGCELLLQPL